MKLIVLFSLLSIVSTNVLAAQPTEVMCWGQDKNGEQIRFTVDQLQKKVQLEKQQDNGDMPPYPYFADEEWSMNELSYNDNDITIRGVTTGVTTGKHGRLQISGNTSGVNTDYGLKRVYYYANVSIIPQVNVLKPVLAITYPVTCQTTTKLEESVQTVGQRCEKQVVQQLRTAYNKKNKGSICKFENGSVSNTKYTGEIFSVLEVRVDACGGSGVEETLVENKTCNVVKSSMVWSD